MEMLAWSIILTGRKGSRSIRNVVQSKLNALRGFSMTTNRIPAFAFVTVLLLGAGGLAAQEPFRLQEATIDQIQAALKSKRLTCRDLIGHYLKRIEAYDQAGPK